MLEQESSKHANDVLSSSREKNHVTFFSSLLSLSLTWEKWSEWMQSNLVFSLDLCL